MENQWAILPELNRQRAYEESLLGIMTDPREHQRMEETFPKGEERYRSLLNSMDEGLGICEIVLDDRGNPYDYRYLEVNPAFEKLTGLSRHYVQGKTARELIPSDEPYGVVLFGRVALTGESRSQEDYVEGLGKWFNARAFSLERGKFAYIFTDVTDRKQAEAALYKSRDELENRVKERSKDLENAVKLLQAEMIHRKGLEERLRESEKRVRFFAAQCLTTQEAERKRIAGELHDSIAASLSAIKFSIEKTIGQMEQGAVTAGSLRDLLPIVGQAIGEVRRIMADLRPSVLDDFGIVATLNWFCREWQKTYSHICVEKQVEISEGEVPDSLKAVIYRISQEALNNIAKHSKACQVVISLRKGRRRIELTIQDNGHGVDLDHARKGLGLSTMKERAEYSGGSFDIVSAVGKGTTIRVSWPNQPLTLQFREGSMKTQS